MYGILTNQHEAVHLGGKHYGQDCAVTVNVQWGLEKAIPIEKPTLVSILIF